MTTGERIKSLRLALGLSQEELGAVVGLKKAAIYKYEKGLVVNLKRDIVSKLAVALHTSPSYLLGLRDNTPKVTDDTVTLDVIGEVAAGYNHIADQEWEGDKVEVPRAWLRGKPKQDYFALRVIGNSMYPLYIDGDIVIALKQATMNHSGEIGVVIYDDEIATLKRIDYVTGEDWMKLTPINPNYEPIIVEGENLEHCRVLGIPRILIRDLIKTKL